MKTMTKIFRCESAIKEVERAQERAAEVIREAYPEGSTIEWQKFRGMHRGTVIRNGSYNRWQDFYVRNDITGREYWISFYDVKMAADI